MEHLNKIYIVWRVTDPGDYIAGIFKSLESAENYKNKHEESYLVALRIQPFDLED